MKTRLVLLGVFLVVVAIIGSVFVLNSHASLGKAFSTSVKGLPFASETEVIELKDGDTFNLTASFVKKNINGNEVRMLAYNGSIPGPTLKVAQGSTITVQFKNDTDIANTIHSHGVRLKNEFDGVPDVTQSAVQPGDSFSYTLTFPDAGAYWYHPHVRDDYAVELGLYGSFLVTPESPAYWNTVDREVVVFLDDILIEKGKIAPFYKDVASHALMGRYGNIMLTNGEADYVLTVKKNEVIRFYFTNSANVRPFNLSIEGIKMKLVGGDSGAYEREEWKDTVLVTPSERVIIEARFDESGEYEMQNKNQNGTTRLGRIIVSDESVDSTNVDAFETLRENTDHINDIDPFRPFFAKAIDKHITLSLDMMGGSMGTMGHGAQKTPSSTSGAMTEGSVPEGGIEWDDVDTTGMNAMMSNAMLTWNIIDKDSGKVNMDIDWKFKVGDKVKIRIENDGSSEHPMQHPIHFHGQRFLVLSTNGVPETNLVWKDTVHVAAGEYVDILIDMANPGVWMSHCHILEHIEAGMMFAFTVEE